MADVAGDLHAIFKQVNWQIGIYTRKIDIEQKAWSLAEIHKFMLDISCNYQNNSESIARLICIPKIAGYDYWGFMFDGIITR